MASAATTFEVEHDAGLKAPLATQLVAALAKKAGKAQCTFRAAPLAASPVALLLASADPVRGDDTEVACALAAAAGLAAPGAEWAALARSLQASDGFEAALPTLGAALTKERPFLSAQDGAGAADAVVAAALHRSGKWDMRAHGKKYPTVARWFQQLKHNADLKPVWAAADAAAAAAPAAAPLSRSLAGSQGRFGVVDVAEGTVVTTRFPPEPSGFLHIGHIKAALMNEYFAHIKYKGKLIVRFDDTNPAKEKREFYDSILSDLALVGITADVVTYTSDYFDLLLQYAERLIREGNGYVDDAPREDVKAGRMNGTETPCRANSVERNLELFEEMKRGTEHGAKCVLRAKIDMQHKNRVMRDPAMYRCVVGKEHLRAGSKYNVYPLYDFCIPIIDSIEGVTHALRSSEYHDRNELYNWVADIFKLRKPVIEDFSRLNFAYVLLSKRKLQWFVDTGKVPNWEDPRFPTVRGLLRRGLTVQAMREFVQSQGSSKALNLMEMDKLWVINKRIIDPIVPRFTAIEDAPKCLLRLEGPDAPAAPFSRTDIPRHKKNAQLGTKTVWFSNEILLEGEDAATLAVGEEVTLMDWGNAVIDSIERDPSTNAVTAATGHLHLAGAVKDTKKKLTWLSTSSQLVPLDLVEYDHLITAEKVPEGADFEAVVRPVSKVVTRALGCAELGAIHVGDKLQLERRGYFICDGVPAAPGEPVILNMIPDGSTRRMLCQKIVLKY